MKIFSTKILCTLTNLSITKATYWVDDCDGWKSGMIADQVIKNKLSILIPSKLSLFSGERIMFVFLGACRT